MTHAFSRGSNARCLIAAGVMVALSLTVRAGHAAATSVYLEVPLPELNRTYDDWVPPVTTQFSVGISPDAILSASIHLRGNLPWPSYTTSCGYNGIIFSLEIPAEAGKWSTEFYVNVRVNFEVFAPLLPTGGATWDFLSQGQGSITCSGAARELPPGCKYVHGGCCPMGEVTYASIILEYDPTTPIEVTTWGRIKALYR